MNNANLNKDNNDGLERIWQIRDYISELEDVKDKFIEYISSDDDIDNSTRSIWISNAKDFYFCTVTAWEMLHFTVREIKNHVDDSKGFVL